MRTFRRTVALAALALATVPLSQALAQDSECRNLRFRSHFRLNGAQRYLEQAEQGRHEDLKQRAADNGIRVLTEAAQNPAGADPMTMWFMFGRFYALKNDVRGADSAFRRAEALLAEDERCRNEITRLRRNMWIPLQEEAVGLLQAQNFDSALAVLRRSNLIYRDDPSGYMNMAVAFMQQERYDSAAVASRAASRAGTDPSRAELRRTAAFNAARLYSRANLHVAAESAYREYMRLNPRDVEGPTGLAASLVAQGRGDAASAIYDSLMNNADSLSSFDLFDMGVALFRTAQLDTADAARQKARFQQTARAFEAGLRKNPTHRDALFNLTNSYLAADDTANVLAAAQRLVGVDSMNAQALTLLARGHQMNRQPNETVRVLARRDSLPFQVSVQRFQPSDSTATLRGAVQNVRTSEMAGFNLALEFLNGRNEVVATERVEIPALNPMGSPGAMYDFNITAAGRGIISYRYRVQ